MRTRREQALEALIEPTVEALGCRVWGVEYLAGGKHATLRIYIDKDVGVSVDDCERVSRQVSGLLDVEEPIQAGYTLEVSSPGMDRILFKPEQYVANVGETVELRLNFPFEGRRKVTGPMVGFEDDEAIVRVDDEEFLIPLENVHRARVVPRFD